MWYFRSFIFFAFLHVTFQRRSPIRKRDRFVKTYLTKYGHLTNWAPLYGPVLKRTIQSFQRLAGINATGKIDEKTWDLMQLPRCGNGDGYWLDSKQAWKVSNSKWKKKLLTWSIEESSKHFTKKQLTPVFEKAFFTWQKEIDLTFSHVETNGDIKIRFVKKHFHNDPYPFDGENGTIGHAFYPHNNKGLSGDIHFDDSDTFSLMKDNKKNYLPRLALHMIGHSIGLEHNNIRESVMYPLRSNDVIANLDKSDIEAAQYIYGKRRTPTLTTTRSLSTLSTKSSTQAAATTQTTANTTTTTSSEMPTTTSTTATIIKRTIKQSTTTTASSSRTTTTTTTASSSRTTTTTTTVVSTTSSTKKPSPKVGKKCYAFERVNAVFYNAFHERIVLFTNDKSLFLVGEIGKPLKMKRSTFIPYLSIPGVISATAVLTIKGERKLFIFSGSSYYIYRERYFGFISGPHSIYNKNHPLEISLPSSVNQIDGAVELELETLLFSRENVWDMKTMRKMKINEKWKDIPSSIDSVYREKENLIFVKNDHVFIVNQRTSKLETVMSLQEHFFKCGV